MIKCPCPGREPRAQLREAFASALSRSSAVTGLKDFYRDRIHIMAAAAPSVTDNKRSFSLAQLTRTLKVQCECVAMPERGP